MHDLLRSFAHYVARHNKEIDIADKANSQKFLRLSLEPRGSESDELEWYSLQAQSSLRTLLVRHIKIKPGESFLAFSNLRILHVEDANFDALVESLNQLKRLRYLSIIGTKTSRLPENIGKMKLLQYINVYGCKRLVKLPCST
jgi:Leucine-rich repeat (LRR) protein